MKTRQLRSFLEEFLTFQGAAVERRGEHLLAVRPPKRWAPVMGGRDLVLAFNLQGLLEDPHSELGTVGNPVFDRILEWARQSGRVGERFEHPVKARKAPSPFEHFRFEGAVHASDPIPAYTPLYFILFRIEYSLEEVADELEVVPVDGISLQTLAQTPELIEYWEGLERDPEQERAIVPAFPIPRDALRSSLRFLEKRLRKRLGKVRKESDEHLERETDSIGTYYRQLIEETRNAGRRWTLPAGGREERIRLLQLDWKRRVEEAQQYWRPHLDVRVAAAAATQRPRTAFRIARGPARKAARARATGSHRGSFVYWDEIEQRFVEPSCRRCGTPGLIELAAVEDGFLCPRCRRVAEEEIPAAAAKGARQGQEIAGRRD
jgi:hypothetical protein